MDKAELSQVVLRWRRAGLQAWATRTLHLVRQSRIRLCAVLLTYSCSVDHKHNKTPKRAKLNSDTPTSTPSQPQRAPSQSATPSATSQTPQPHPPTGSSLVELKGNKFVVNQKPLDWTTKLSYTQGQSRDVRADAVGRPRLRELTPLGLNWGRCWGVCGDDDRQSTNEARQLA